MNTGKFIKNHRKNLNMTQKELAKTLGVHFITVCRWETNFITPSPYHLAILKNLFGTRKDPIIFPDAKKIVTIEPLKKLDKKGKCDDRNKEVVNNYQKGISVNDLAKFYNLKECSIRSILLSQKVKIVRKFTKKDRTCVVCKKVFHGRNKKTCGQKCLKTLRKNNNQNNYKVEKNHTCCVCNKDFISNKSRVYTNKYCSQTCYQMKNSKMVKMPKI